ncbi:MAG: phage major capsid protein [Alphaproteobacteria bacterium]|nr:phage major capsid protein [Alphaproteobacteria bacterium]
MRCYSERGIGLAQGAIAIARAKGFREHAPTMARRLYGEPAARFVEENLRKAAVPAAVTSSANWGGAIAGDDGWEFVERVDERSVFGALTRRIPLNVNVATWSAGVTAFWRGEGKPVPASSGVTTSTPIPARDVCALIAVSNELIECGAPGVAEYLLDELVRACAAALDTALLDPTNAGVSGIMPASLTYGVTPVTATSDADEDIAQCVANFPGDLTRALWIARPQTFAAVHSYLHQGVGLAGGEILGAPAVASRYAPEFGLILVDVDGVVYGDDGVIVETAEHASIEMLNAALQQDATTGTGAALVSLWQAGMTGYLVRRRTNWQVARPCVSMIDGINWHNLSA